MEVIKYNIIPMTNEFGHNGGLIRWIENSDPINTLLKRIRNRFNVEITLEKIQVPSSFNTNSMGLGFLDSRNF